MTGPINRSVPHRLGHATNPTLTRSPLGNLPGLTAKKSQLRFDSPAVITASKTLVQAFFGRLAPYLDRDCRRSLTPCRSSEPRTMW